MKTFKTFVYISILFLLGCGSNKYNVLFGEKSVNDFDRNIIRIHFDSEGILYPVNCFIPNEILKENGCSFMKTWQSDAFKIKKYSGGQNCNDCFKEYNELYNLDSTEFMAKFNEKTIKRIKGEIEQLGIKNITFLMVGFNNSFDNPTQANDNALFKLKTQREKIESVIDKKSKTIFVEVYWDGTSTIKNGIRTAINYSTAIQNSLKAGLGLRQLINSLSDEYTINLFSHSLGANLICETLFNQETKIPRNKINQRVFFDYLMDKYSEPAFKTPHKKKINAVLVAPAISGLYTFLDYYNRSEPINNLNDNYKIYIGYNVNDPTLRKSFGKGTIGFAINLLNTKNKLVITKPFNSTSLGCLDSEVRKVDNLFRRRFDSSKIEFVDFSFTEINGRNAANTFHGILDYLNKPQYEKLVKKVFQIPENSLLSSN